MLIITYCTYIQFRKLRLSFTESAKNGVCYISASAIPIDGRGRVLGIEFGVGNLLLRYDFFYILLEQTN
jgi:hypothetical protein